MTELLPLADLGRLSHAEKDALIMALWTRLDEALAQIDELRRGLPSFVPRALAAARASLVRFEIASRSCASSPRPLWPCLWVQTRW